MSTLQRKPKAIYGYLVCEKSMQEQHSPILCTNEQESVQTSMQSIFQKCAGMCQ